MAYYKTPKPRLVWDKPGPWQGVTIQRLLGDGNWYAWRIPHNGVVPQAMAADILGVSVMAVNKWVNAGTVRHIKAKGQPSLVPLTEIKRVRKIMDEYGRLRKDALDQ